MQGIGSEEKGKGYGGRIVGRGDRECGNEKDIDKISKYK